MENRALVDADWRGLYKAGGIAWPIVGLLYFLEIPLFFLLASSLSSADAAVEGLSGKALILAITVAFALLAHLISVPGILALYLALKGVNRSAMLVAAAFLGLYLVLDLAVATPNLLSLIALSQDYSAASSDVQRTADLVTGKHVFAIFSVVTPIYGSLVPSIGVLITGLVMRTGIFSRPVAYLGVAAGAVGIVAGLGVFVPALSFLDVANLTLFGIWLLLLGRELYNLEASALVRAPALG